MIWGLDFCILRYMQFGQSACMSHLSYGLQWRQGLQIYATFRKIMKLQYMGLDEKGRVILPLPNIYCFMHIMCLFYLSNSKGIQGMAFGSVAIVKSSAKINS